MPVKGGRFVEGDRVRLRAEHRDTLTPVRPIGIVSKVAPYGKGQVIKIGDHSGWQLAGMYEHDGD